MGMGSSGGGSRAVPYINVTPLIYVLLVLLIIFMVITPLKPSRFQADIPSPRDKNEDTSKLRPNPLTLVVFVGMDLKIKLNNSDNPKGGDPCLGKVPDYGSVNDPSHLALCLRSIFDQRRDEKPPPWKTGLEPGTEAGERLQKNCEQARQPAAVCTEQRIEKTVFVKAPQALHYGEVVKVIDALKGAGANPVGLQLDDLPQ